MSKYVFVDPNYDDEYLPMTSFTHGLTYYQITSFKNPHTQLFQIRAFEIDPRNNFKNINTFNVTKKQVKTLKKSVNPTHYSEHGVYKISDVNYPSKGDIDIARSNLSN